MPDTEKSKPAAAKRPSGLGRGLSALLGDIQTEAPVSRGTPAAGQGGTAVAQRDGLSSLPVVELHPHPDQPRRHFDEKALVDLTLAVIAINGWNRLSIAFQVEAGSYQPPKARP